MREQQPLHSGFLGCQDYPRTVLSAKIMHAGGEGHESEDGHAVLGQQRSTLCVSSQVGCQMGCTFCATGGAPRALSGPTFLIPRQRPHTCMLDFVTKPLFNCQTSARPTEQDQRAKRMEWEVLGAVQFKER